MWKSQLGSKEVKTITQTDDDDWETDPDFVVSQEVWKCSHRSGECVDIFGGGVVVGDGPQFVLICMTFIDLFLFVSSFF